MMPHVLSRARSARDKAARHVAAALETKRMTPTHLFNLMSLFQSICAALQMSRRDDVRVLLVMWTGALSCMNRALCTYGGRSVHGSDGVSGKRPRINVTPQLKNPTLTWTLHVRFVCSKIACKSRKNRNRVLVHELVLIHPMQLSHKLFSLVRYNSVFGLLLQTHLRQIVLAILIAAVAMIFTSVP